jgi:hypothetical protein
MQAVSKAKYWKNKLQGHESLPVDAMARYLCQGSVYLHLGFWVVLSVPVLKTSRSFIGAWENEPEGETKGILFGFLVIGIMKLSAWQELLQD